MIAIAIQQTGDKNPYRICSYPIAMYDVSPYFLMPKVRAYLGERTVNLDVLEHISLSDISLDFLPIEPSKPMPKTRKNVARKPKPNQRIFFKRDQESAG